MWLFSDVLPEAESWVCVFDGKMTTRGREREETNKHQNWKWKVEDLGQRRIGDLGESLQEGKRNTTEGGKTWKFKALSAQRLRNTAATRVCHDAAFAFSLLLREPRSCERSCKSDHFNPIHALSITKCFFVPKPTQILTSVVTL